MYIENSKKYLFSILVASYLIMVIGIPVYFHYCGGELEEISYLTKTNSCCGDEQDSEEESNGCCSNESLVLKNSSDFTFTNYVTAVPEQTCLPLFQLDLPSPQFSFHTQTTVSFIPSEFPPPRWQHDCLLSITVLRI